MKFRFALLVSMVIMSALPCVSFSQPTLPPVVEMEPMPRFQPKTWPFWYYNNCRLSCQPRFETVIVRHGQLQIPFQRLVGQECTWVCPPY